MCDSDVNNQTKKGLLLRLVNKKLKSVNIWHIVTIGKKVVVSCTLCAWPVATTYTVTVAAKI